MTKLTFSVMLGASVLIALSPLRGFAGDLSHVRISYADLDLATPAGAQALYGRIAIAAGRVCPSVDMRQLRESAAADECVKTTITDAVKTFNSPQLSAVYAQKMGLKAAEVLASR
jgi:UrcA family protein